MVAAVTDIELLQLVKPALGLALVQIYLNFLHFSLESLDELALWVMVIGEPHHEPKTETRAACAWLV